MFGRKVVVAAPVMALLMCGTAHAALTVDKVWADLQAAATAGGMKITVATEVAGDGELTLNGVTIAPEGAPTIATISELSLVEQDDGSVAFFPGEIKLEDTAPATVTVDHQELSVSVFQDEAGLGYGIDADSLKIVVDVAEGAGETAKSFAGTFDLTGLGGRYTRGAAALGLELGLEKLAYDIKQVDAALSMDTAQISETDDLAVTGEMTLPEGIDLMSLQGTQAVLEAARAGLGLALTVTQGASRGEVVDNNPFFPMSLAFTTQPGETGVVLNAEEVTLASSVEGFEFEARPPMVPAPAKAAADSFGMAFSMPMSAVEAAGEYSLAVNVGNLVADESVWAMFDPQAALDHGPLDLALDLGGLAKIDAIDLMLSSETGTPPKSVPEVQTLDIRALAAKVAGAALTGTGAFTFDNSMVAAGGPPMPIGTADLRLEGANKLIDGLIKLGVLTEEDATGARMMMAMFGTPDGDDVLTSKIEAKEGGSIFVNGQQIQ